MSDIRELSQTIRFAIPLTITTGFTVILKTAGVPVHPLAEGVTTKVAFTGAVPVFEAKKAGIFPFPECGNPIEGVSFVQVKVVPATLPVRIILLQD